MIFSQPPAIDLHPGEQLLFTGRAHRMPTLVEPVIAICIVLLLLVSVGLGGKEMLLLTLGALPFIRNAPEIVAWILVLALVLFACGVFYQRYRDSRLIITNQRLLIRWGGILGAETEEFPLAAVEMPSDHAVHFGTLGFSRRFGYGTLWLTIDRRSWRISDLEDPRAALVALRAAKEAQASR